MVLQMLLHILLLMLLLLMHAMNLVSVGDPLIIILVPTSSTRVAERNPTLTNA